MKIEIKHRWTGSILFSTEAENIRDALQQALRSGSNLRGSDLRASDLSGSDLRASDLSGSDLSGSNLRGSDLRGSNLSGSDLRGSNLRGSDLSGSNLSGSNLGASNLRGIRDDLWAVLSSAPKEAEGLRQALMDGNVNGSSYTGMCACLVGTIANLRGVDYRKLGVLQPDSNRPAECFFFAIKKGDTPSNSQLSKLAVTWIDEWLLAMRSAFG